MGELWHGLIKALELLWHLDRDLLRIVLLSLEVSGTALLISITLGIPLGCWLGFKRFIGRRITVALLYTGMGLPPVVVGLFVYLVLSRSGPLGSMQLLFTPGAMIIAQVIIALPLIAGFTMVAVMGVEPDFRKQVISLGATEWQAALGVIREARIGVLVSIIAGFGGIISEVGAVMIVGGNIEGYTRVLTTAIVLETRKGAYDMAMALGIILLAISFIINIVMVRLQGRYLER